jgi:hypothetical protein
MCQQLVRSLTQPPLSSPCSASAVPSQAPTSSRTHRRLNHCHCSLAHQQPLSAPVTTLGLVGTGQLTYRACCTCMYAVGRHSRVMETGAHLQHWWRYLQRADAGQLPGAPTQLRRVPLRQYSQRQRRQPEQLQARAGAATLHHISLHYVPCCNCHGHACIALAKG